MKALYKRPTEWGKWSSLSISIFLSSPLQIEAVHHSPTPSIVSIALSLKLDGKNVLAAWDKWCSVNKRFSFFFFKLGSISLSLS